MIRYAIPIKLLLVGDDSTSSFSFGLDDVFGVFTIQNQNAFHVTEFDQLQVLNKTTIPDAVTFDFSSGISGSASINHRTVSVVFASALPSASATTIQLSLLFNG